MPVLFVLLLLVASASVAVPRVCTSAKLPLELSVEGFKYNSNHVASRFKARHSINDGIAVLGKQAQIEGKFVYGYVAKDLTNETVELWVDSCKDKLVFVDRQKTDKKGRVTFHLPTTFLKEPGQYAVVVRVVGDGSVGNATLRVVPEGKKVAVFDIDGTLSAHESDVTLGIMYEILRGVFSPPKRAFGPEITHFLHEKGYEIVYLSARHYLMNNLTRRWLHENKFVPGTLKVTRSFFQTLPKPTQVGQFKTGELQGVTNAGLSIVRAYGNAQTDVFAYRNVGVRDDRIFVLGKHSGQFGAVGLGTDFEAHYKELTRPGNTLLD